MLLAATAAMSLAGRPLVAMASRTHAQINRQFEAVSKT
jgi:hypothetical protein